MIKTQIQTQQFTDTKGNYMAEDQRTLQLLKKIIERLKNVELRTASAMKKASDNKKAITTLADNTQKIISRIEKMVMSPKRK